MLFPNVWKNLFHKYFSKYHKISFSHKTHRTFIPTEPLWNAPCVHAAVRGLFEISSQLYMGCALAALYRASRRRLTDRTILLRILLARGVRKYPIIRRTRVRSRAS